MARTFIRYFIEAQDETEDAARSISERFTDLTRNLATGFATVAVALVEGITEAIDRAEGVIQRLTRAQGNLDSQDLTAELLRAGVAENDAIAAVQALQGPGSVLGISGPAAAAGLAGVSAVGADPTGALQAAIGYGVGGDSALDQIALAIATAQTSGQDPSELLTALEEYGPVLAELGLSFLESVQFISDLRRSGVQISRVSPALNQFIRRASAEGVDARTATQTAFDAIRQAEPEQANAIAQGLFGAEGGLRLARGIRTGAIGLGEELRFDESILGQTSLAGLNAPTTREAFDSAATSLTLSDNIIHRIVGGLAPTAGDIPLLGDLTRNALRPSLQGPGAGSTLGDSLGIAAELGNLNAHLDDLVNINRAQLDTALLNPQSPDFAERIIQAANTDRGRLAE
ncbi:hypothetical protein [Candidatus Poriferisocius sp.]|uniref:hypothetical protein n=1 Tax=Candidatus Poriferisocius sp. TaxID=3101276 RepID=UPI003B515837